MDVQISKFLLSLFWGFYFEVKLLDHMGILFFSLLFRAALATCGNSQARDWIGAAAAGLCHNNTMPDPSLIFDLHHSSEQRWILNPLIEARDRIHILKDTSWIRFHCTTMGTPIWEFCLIVLGIFTFSTVASPF